KLGRAVAVSGVTVIGQLSSSWRADTRLAARLRQKVIGRSLARHLGADRRISVCEEGTVVKRTIFSIALAVGLAAWIGAAQAQNFPVRPITLILPWPAGGTTDVGMRALATATEKHLGQSIVIENRPGGSGTLAPGQMAATAKPDGYTIAQIPITIFRFPFMTKTTFDPSTDFTYIIGISGYTFGELIRRGRRSRSSSPTPRPTPARSTMARRAPAPACTSRWSRLPNGRGSNGPTSRSRATPR